MPTELEVMSVVFGGEEKVWEEVAWGQHCLM